LYEIKGCVDGTVWISHKKFIKFRQNKFNFFINGKKLNRLKILYLLAAVALLFCGCEEQQTKSIWRTHDIKIDGSQLDWDNNISYQRSSGAGLGIMNDDKNLYLCVAIINPHEIIHILRTGFAVWFESKDDDSGMIGIEYPVELFPEKKTKEENESGLLPDMEKSEIAGGKDTTKSIPDSTKLHSKNKTQKKMTMEERINKLIQLQDKFEILNKEQNPINSYTLGTNPDIKVKVGYQSGQLVYELKIPLKNESKNSYYVNASAGEPIRIGFQTNSPSQVNYNELGEEGDFNGRGGMQPGESEYPGEEQGQQQRPVSSGLNFWLNVSLAASNSNE
jgi:hypothetical protein